LRQHDVEQHAQAASAQVARRLDVLRLDRCHCAREEQRHERGLLPHEGDDDASPVEQALRLQRLDHSGPDQHVVQHAVLGEERAHDLPGDDERDEQRPAVEPAQHRDGALVLAQREIPCNRDRHHADQDRGQEHDADREDEILLIQVPRLGEVFPGEAAARVAESEDRGEDQRKDEEQRDDRERRRDERIRAPSRRGTGVAQASAISGRLARTLPRYP
jgi:hypothetical protein